MKKRFLALLLSCAIVFGMMPGSFAQAVAAETDVPAICFNGDAADNVDLPQNEKILLTVSGSAADYQWQIEDFNGEWANIAGSTDSALRLSYAMVANLLDGGAVSLRCRVSDESGVSYTDPVTVNVTAPTRSAPVQLPSLGEVITDAWAADSLPATDPADPAEEPVASSSGDENAISEPWNIVIHYVFEDGTEAAAPWTASVATDITYSTTVTSPTVVGYAPDQETVEISITAGETPVTNYQVTYSPAEVTYTVNHWQQNVSDNGYTRYESTTNTARTESQVGGALAKTYEGFYSLLYDTTTAVAADGSTVVDIYYDRLYYLISFDLDGGHGVEPVYARYGADIDVGEPQRAGYTFAGWDKEIPATVPARNLTFKALWTPADTAKVTMVFWGQDADDTNESKYSYLKSSEVYVKPGTQLTYSDNGTLICGLEEHNHIVACYTCNQINHAHDESCYENTGSTGNPLFAPSNPVNGQIHNELFVFPYIYINGTWYHYFGSLSDGDIASTTCGLTENTHTHTDDCLGCGEIEHTHSESCYSADAELDTSLWYFRNSDTVTVAADGTTILNVYYNRKEFTLTFRNDNRTVATITAKWGAKISNEFDKAPFNTTYDGRAWKCTDTSKYDYALQTLDRMPAFNATFNLYNQSSYTKKTIYYYVEKIGARVSASQWPQNNANFDLLKEVDTFFNYATYDEEYHDIDGFTRYSATTAGFRLYGNTGKNFSNNKLNLYYMRNNYNLRFYNYHTELTDRIQSVPYEDQIQKYTFTPSYPEGLKPGAYVFEGWYTDQFFHNKVTDASQMPANDVMLFARWVPNTHTVRTYLTSEMDALLHIWEEIPNGSTIEDPPADPKRDGGYKFVGWFYLDNGQEKAFDFSMPINRDLDLYAKWSSNVLKNYTIHYQLEDSTPIAPDETGSALAGSTKTFDAKAGTQLNAGYQSGYFPQTSSHSLVMDMDESKNEYTFIYVQLPEVSYTVRYLDKATGEPISPDKTATTSKAIITEEYVRVNGYRPDAYRKNLILSANADENVLIFWYTESSVHAPVHIVHWLQNVVGDGYTEHLSTTELDGIIGSNWTEDALEIPGYYYNEAKSKASGTVSADGLELDLYYDRIEYPYEFRFLEQGTNRPLADPVKGLARYQAQVTQKALNIPGYTLVSAENQAVKIAIENPADQASKNVRIFYYKEIQADIQYKVVGPQNCGTLSLSKETLKVLTGTASGSTATAKDGFRFVGWFTDEACSIPADSTWISGAKLTPGKTQNYGTEENPVLGYAPATYYAKFEYDVTDLTITKSGWESIDENQTFLFDVTGPNGYSTRVAICGNGSVTIAGLKIGEYTVTEVGSWSWRYLGPNAQTVTLDPTGENAVTFRNTRTIGKWLSGDAYSNNIFNH